MLWQQLNFIQLHKNIWISSWTLIDLRFINSVSGYMFTVDWSAICVVPRDKKTIQFIYFFSTVIFLSPCREREKQCVAFASSMRDFRHRSRDKNNSRDPCSPATIRLTPKDIRVSTCSIQRCIPRLQRMQSRASHCRSRQLALAKPNDAFRCYRDQGTVARSREKSRQRRRNAAKQIGPSHLVAPLSNRSSHDCLADDIRADRCKAIRASILLSHVMMKHLTQSYTE